MKIEPASRFYNAMAWHGHDHQPLGVDHRERESLKKPLTCLIELLYLVCTIRMAMTSKTLDYYLQVIILASRVGCNFVINLKCLQETLRLVSFSSNGYREPCVYILVLSPGRTLLLGTCKRRT